VLEDVFGAGDRLIPIDLGLGFELAGTRGGGGALPALGFVIGAHVESWPMQKLMDVPSGRSMRTFSGLAITLTALWSDSMR
jgi:hypothetical protein